MITTLDSRVARLRTHTDTINNAGLYRSAAYGFIGDSLRASVGQPIQLRRARGIANILDNVEQIVFPDEPIVGSMMGLWTLETEVPSYEDQKKTAIAAVEDYLRRRAESEAAKAKNPEEEVFKRPARWSLMSRVHHDASLTYSDYQKMLADMEEHFSGEDIKRYEIGSALEPVLRIRHNEEDRKLMDALPWSPCNHVGLDYNAALVKGLGRMRDEINAYRAATDDADKIEFYDSADIVIRAMIAFIKRYAQTVRKAAESGDDDFERKQELEMMADILDKVSESPPETFREALQALWMLHIMSNLVGGTAMSFSRFDQYMLPFYERDMENGVAREEIAELLCCFWLKINEPKIRTVQSMTVGGTRPDGGSGDTDFTKLCLEVAGEMKLPYPNIAARVSKKTPDWLYDSIVETIKAGCGQPMILNDDVFAENYKKLGYSDDFAYDYFNMGCVEMMIQGKTPLWAGGGGAGYMKCLTEVLAECNKGELAADSFEEFMGHILAKIREALKRSREGAQKRKKSLENVYDPLCSILMQDCIARGKDMFHGGSAGPIHMTMGASSIGTMADSLAAIKKFIYDEKRLTLSRLMEAMDANFEGYEDILVMLDRENQCFGNDIDETDEIANRVFQEVTNTIFELNSLGDEDKYVSTFFSYFTHVLTGEATKATPNGRLAGKSLSDSMAPSQGKDVSGPTGYLNSALKLDPALVTGGYALNFKINPSLTKGAQGSKALKGLLKAFFMSGGPQIQVNFVDADALRAAQADPEKHRNLVVRVGGYCEYFVNLDRALQNEIIERTAHDA
ncbi:MAG: DUF3029 family protein [Oscillospiraceae bacterium]|nr:DUF3029 family protein [Oscillospiraceae bacterium]